MYDIYDINVKKKKLSVLEWHMHKNENKMYCNIVKKKKKKPHRKAQDVVKRQKASNMTTV